LENGSLTVRFEASDPATRALLEAGAGALKSALEGALLEKGQQAAVTIQFEAPKNSGASTDSSDTGSEKHGEPGQDRERKSEASAKGRVSAKSSTSQS
jgi:hypothetical protein